METTTIELKMLNKGYSFEEVCEVVHPAVVTSFGFGFQSLNTAKRMWESYVNEIARIDK